MDPSLRRVKAYHLLSDDWVDLGTGQVALIQNEAQGFWKIVVHSESTHEILLDTKVGRDVVYNRQQDSLIVWCEPDTTQDYSLSFQEAVGCTEFWELLLHTQRNYALESSIEELPFEFHAPLRDNYETVDLPAVNMANIDLIESMVQGPGRREPMAASMHRVHYIEQLLDLFQMCEDLESQDHLRKMFYIFKSILMWNKPPLIEEMTGQNLLLRFIGVFEYDPDMPPKHRQHRKFLENDTKFQMVIPFPTELVALIHQAYRLQYLKDIILSRILDDPTFATVTSLCFFLNLQIVRDVVKDPQLIPRILTRVTTQLEEVNQVNRKKDATAEEVKAAYATLQQSLYFLQELSTTARNMQPMLKGEYFNGLVSQGLFEILIGLFGERTIEVRLAGAEIMNGLLSYDPALLRRYLLAHKNDSFLAELMLNRFIHDPDEGMRNQMLEMIRALIDTDQSGNVPAKEREDFLSYFYAELIGKLLVPFTPGFDDKSGWVRYNIVDLFTSCVKMHSFRIRYFLLNQHVIEKLVKLVSSPLKFLAIACLRFLKALIAQRDTFYIKHLTKFHLLEPIVEVFLKSKDQYNLLNSTVLDLFEAIRADNNKLLLESLVPKYEQQFLQITYVGTFAGLVTHYHQHKDAAENPPPPSASAVAGPPPMLLPLGFRESREQELEDRWFEDEEDAPPLVPYEGPETEREFIPLKRSSSEEDGFVLRDNKKLKFAD